MIDLHAHTSESDGSFSPSDLVALAHSIRLEALAITDHDTFAGFDLAKPLADQLGLELLCGIEVSTKYEDKSVHLMGYFLRSDPGEEFRNWITKLQNSRHERNRLLLDTLKAHGVEISAEELAQRGGPLPGRPQMAMLMMERGYVQSIQQAFDDYLDESASCYIQREEPSFAETLEKIRDAGGVASLPHPCRVTRDAKEITDMVTTMRDMGLAAIETCHSEHSVDDVLIYTELARHLGLAVTGGSDFHGARKPAIELGTGRNKNVCIPYSVLEQLRSI